ncbi:MAG: EamA family transporter [bacterium]|nr:MAG: EamA family transporter [bacterium]
MTSSALLLIISSAFFHAVWNAVVKRVEARFNLLALAHVMMAAGLTPFLGPAALQQVKASPILLISLAGAAFFFSLYHLGVAGGYRSGDLSVIYPLTTMAPALVPLWGALFLGERLVWAGFAGIGLIILGAYVIQFQSVSLSAVLDPFKRFDRSVAFALGAAFFYSVGAAFDKAGISHTDALTWSYLLIVVMAVVESALAAGTGMGYWSFTKAHWRSALGMAFILLASILTYRYGLKVTEVSYATSVRQVNALFGVLMGIFFFRERLGGLRMAAAVVMVGGVVIIKIFG